MKMRKLVPKCLITMSFAFLWTEMVQIVLKCCSGNERPWMSISVRLIVAILPLVEGIFHYYSPTGKGLTGSKMLFGKMKVGIRLYLMLQIALVLLVYCVFSLIFIGTTDIDRKAMIMLFVIAGLYFAGEALGYYMSKIVDLASRLFETTNHSSEK